MTTPNPSEATGRSVCLPPCAPGDPQHLNDYILQELTQAVRGLREDVAELKGLTQKTHDRIFLTNGSPSLIDEVRDIKANGSQPLRAHVAEHRVLERKLVLWLISALLAGGGVVKIVGDSQANGAPEAPQVVLQAEPRP